MRSFPWVLAATAVLASARTASAQQCAGDSAADRAQCYTFLAVQSGDTGYCGLVDGSFAREACYSAVAASSDRTACASVEDDAARVRCTLLGRFGEQRQAEVQQRQSDDADLRALQEEQLEQQRAQVELLRQQLADQQLERAELVRQLDEQRMLMQQQLAEQRRMQRLLEQRAGAEPAPSGEAGAASSAPAAPGEVTAPTPPAQAAPGPRPPNPETATPDEQARPPG